MSVTRINEFRALAGHGNALRDLIRSFVPSIEASPGCLGCQLLQSDEDPTHIVVIEHWESEAAHQASLRHIPPDAMQAAMGLLAAPPAGEYYRS